MKKVIAVMLSVLMVLSVGMLFVSAYDASQSVDVFVTITDGEGKLAVAAEKITVTDVDKDGDLTINDALMVAHDEFYEGGSTAGYATEETKYGLSMVKLWGVENGYNYSYLVNNALAWNLTDPVKDNDYIAAYTFTDNKNLSDRYCYFDKVKEELADTASIELTLNMIDYDEQYNPLVVPVKNAELTVDGEKTGVMTDDNGKVTYEFTANGEYLLSATAAGKVIIPPACRVTVTGLDDSTPDQPVPTTIIYDDDNDTAPTTAVTEAPTDNGSTKDESTKDESTGDQSTSDSPSPKTGDVTKMWLWLLIGAFCLAGIIGAVVFYKKRYGNK